MSDIENDTDAAADAIFDAAMAQEGERSVEPGPSPAGETLTPGDMLEVTVEHAKANRAEAGADASQEPQKSAERVEFKAEDYLAQRDRVRELEQKLAAVEQQGKTAEKQAEQRAGLFEDPDAWEAQRKAEITSAVDEVKAEFRREMIGIELENMQARLGAERYAVINEAATRIAAADPAFRDALDKLPARGFGKTIEAWYEKNEPLLNPAAYEARLREKWEQERSGSDAPNGQPAGQKPATGAPAAGSNVTRLPPSLSRQSAARAATSGDDDGDDSEAAIFRAGANTRRA